MTDNKYDIAIFPKENDFPRLMQSIKYPDLVVLFTSPTIGVVVRSGNNLKVGYSANWFKLDKYVFFPGDFYLLQGKIGKL